jgi:hypothetical protein
LQARRQNARDSELSVVGDLKFLEVGGDEWMLLEMVHRALDLTAPPRGRSVEAHTAARFSSGPANERT